MSVRNAGLSLSLSLLSGDVERSAVETTATDLNCQVSDILAACREQLERVRDSTLPETSQGWTADEVAAAFSRLDELTKPLVERLAAAHTELALRMVEELCEWVALIDDINAAVRASRDGNHAEVVARVAKAVNAEYDLTLDCAHLGSIADDLGIGED